ncbi:MAG: hypothetical protein JSW71_03960 [Gemmatimonadota bacterium]|nr:MAG: hypothetical protein JSW71_03960 [Gemmatimonadota bacterium]
MSVKPPNPPHDSTDKVVRELLRQLPYADPDLRGVPTPPAARRQRQTPGPIMKPKPPGWQRSWGWVTLAVVLAVGLSQWPYTRSCGYPLYGYLAVVILLPVIALRAVVASWIDRRAVAHSFAIVMVLGGLGYCAEVLLPRVNYARISATWQCKPTPSFAVAPAILAGPPLPLATVDPVRAEADST